MFPIEQLQALLKLYKEDLLSLLNSKNSFVAKKILSVSPDKFLNLLCNILHHVCVGHVPISKEKWPTLVKSKRAAYLNKYFKTKTATNSLLKSNREKKLQVLSHFGKVYPILLEKFFEDKSNPQHSDPAITNEIDEASKKS